MKIIPKDYLPEISLPLPLFQSFILADGICKLGDEFDVYIGLEKKYALQLKKLSQDEGDVDLQNYTGDKARFVEGTYEDWYKQSRTVFALVHKQTDVLAALMWFGPKSLGRKSMKFEQEVNADSKDDSENDWHTIAFRSYPPFRGRGVMKNFSKFAIDIYKKHFPKSMFWTGTDDRNTVFLKFISGLGFKINAENSDLPEHWLVMTKK